MTPPSPATGRARLREWWPEAAIACFLVFLGFCGIFAGGRSGPVADVVLAVGYTLAAIGLGWWMGHRHRRLPMQATLDGVRQDVTAVREDVGEMRETVHAAVEAFTAAPPAPPEGYGRPKFRMHKGGMA